MTTMCCKTMNEMLENMLTNLRAQLVVITEDMLHSLCFKKLIREQKMRDTVGYCLSLSNKDLP